MFPVIVTPSELRSKLSYFLNLVFEKPIFVKNSSGNQVILSEEYFNKLTSFAGDALSDREYFQYGGYSVDFVSDMKDRMSQSDSDQSVSSLKDLI